MVLAMPGCCMGLVRMISLGNMAAYQHISSLIYRLRHNAVLFSCLSCCQSSSLVSCMSPALSSFLYLVCYLSSCCSPCCLSFCLIFCLLSYLSVYIRSPFLCRVCCYICRSVICYICRPASCSVCSPVCCHFCRTVNLFCCLKMLSIKCYIYVLYIKYWSLIHIVTRHRFQGTGVLLYFLVYCIRITSLSCAMFKGIVSRDFEWLQMILIDRLCVPDVPLEVHSFLNLHFHIL